MAGSYLQTAVETISETFVSATASAPPPVSPEQASRTNVRKQRHTTSAVTGFRDGQEERQAAKSTVVTSTSQADQTRSEQPRRTDYLQVLCHPHEERVYRLTLFVHQRRMELVPIVERSSVPKAVDLVIEVVDDVLLRLIQLLS
jgi:hypothetical protein